VSADAITTRFPTDREYQCGGSEVRIVLRRPRHADGGAFH
jgi:hypothetical protein